MVHSSDILMALKNARFKSCEEIYTKIFRFRTVDKYFDLSALCKKRRKNSE